MLNRRKFLTSSGAVIAASAIPITSVANTVDTVVLISPDKTEHYKIVNGSHVLHRDDDLPSVIYKDGSKYWYKNGQLHRDNDLPAAIYHDGSQSWYKNNKLHRDNDLPAVIFYNGTKYWYKDGLRHRDNDLPAVVKKDGTQEWYKNGICR